MPGAEWVQGLPPGGQAKGLRQWFAGALAAWLASERPSLREADRQDLARWYLAHRSRLYIAVMPEGTPAPVGAFCWAATGRAYLLNTIQLQADLADAEAFTTRGRWRAETEREGSEFTSLGKWLAAERAGALKSPGIPELAGEWLVGPGRRLEFLARRDRLRISRR